MTTLHDRLAVLADGAPAAVPDPELWDRGRRYQRRRRLGSAVAVSGTLLVLAVIAAATWRTSAQPLPANPPARSAGVPDHLFAPSSWLPGTDDDGPVGPVAAVLHADRASLFTTTKDQPVGVSATTGAYRFLDLPGRDTEVTDVALSPDGRHIAYWLGGIAPGATGTVITGVGLYDTVSGAVRRYPIASSYGLEPGQGVGTGLDWAGSDALVVTYGTNLGSPFSSRDAPPLVWTLTDPAPHRLPELDAKATVAGAGPGFLLVSLDHGYGVADLTTGAVSRRFETAAASMSEPVADPAGSRVALIPGNHLPGSVTLQSLGSPGGQATVVPGTRRTNRVIGWTDPEHLALLEMDQGSPDARTTVVDVDVRTGETRLITTVGEGADFSPTVATALLGNPFAAPAPAHPLDRRWVAGLVGLTLLAGFWLLLRWRRRVRA